MKVSGPASGEVKSAAQKIWRLHNNSCQNDIICAMPVAPLSGLDENGRV
jgi:hypothetical protein